jgi:hypothetical protein
MSKSRKKPRKQAAPGAAGKTGAAGNPRAADGPAGDPGAAELAKRAMIEAHPRLARELEALSPEEAAMFLSLMNKALRKRRIQLAGYLLSAVLMLGGMLLALYMYGTREPGEFVGWALLLPFLLVGAVLLIFGRWSRSV